MIANKNYIDDIKYTMELNRFVFRLLGVWPHLKTKPSFSESVKNISLIAASYFLLCFELIPSFLYIIIVEKRAYVRLKLVSSAMFTALAVLKYTSLVFNRGQMKNCLIQVQNDWRNVTAASRDSMLEKTKIARYIFIWCGIFMYSSGVYFRTIVPISKPKVYNERNMTIRNLPVPSYFIFIDAQYTPAYEIIYFIQLFTGFVKYTVTVMICGLAGLFAMHICAQLEILTRLTDSLVDEREVKKLNRMLAMIVEHQIKIRNFLEMVQDTLQNNVLMEVIGCTIFECLLLHHVLTEWNNQNVLIMGSYIILLTSIGFNVFIFCYIGEQVSLEAEKLSLTTCTLSWYRLPNKKAKALILIIAMSNIPIKLRAGKFIDLSIKTFGDIIKTSVAYFNLIRHVMD